MCCDMKAKAEILEWFDRQPKTEKGYNLLNFLSSDMLKIKEKLEKSKVSGLLTICLGHKELGLSLIVRPYEPLVDVTHFLTFHFWLNEKGHEYLRKVIEDYYPFLNGFPTDLNGFMANEIKHLIFMPNEYVSIQQCGDYSFVMKKIPKGESAKTFKLEPCPRCMHANSPSNV